MAMSVGGDSDTTMSDINTTPLVDVMLVLLIIFIITVPVMKHAVNIELPQATSEPERAQPQNILFTVAADGSYYWNENRIEDSALAPLLAEQAAKDAEAAAARDQARGQEPHPGTPMLHGQCICRGTPLTHCRLA